VRAGVRAFLQYGVCGVYGQAIHAESMSSGGIRKGQNCIVHMLGGVDYVECRGRVGALHCTALQARAAEEQPTVRDTLPRVAPHALN
jgi:hypothetical protein